MSIFADWRRLIANVPSGEARLAIFHRAARDIGSRVGDVLDKSAAVDGLIEVAIAHNYFDVGQHQVEAIVAAELERAAAERAQWELPDTPDAANRQRERFKPNGGDDQPFDPRFKLIPFSALKASTVSAYRVKGLIPSTGLVVVWGPPKCGKSFWTFDLTMHVALGWPYRGRRVKQCPVVYLGLEGGHGFGARADGWRQRHLADHDGDVPFHLLNVPLDLIADYPKLIAAIRAQVEAPGIVVVDTLNRALKGDENKPEDMARFIRAADAIREALDCAVIVIHHCGHEGSRPRGHSSLHGADDALIAIERDAADNVVARVETMRDGSAGAVIVSRLQQVEVATDDDGDRIDTLVIVPADGAATAHQAKVTGAAKVALDLLYQAIADDDDPPVTSNHIPPKTRTSSIVRWRAFCDAGTVSESDDPDNKRRVFVRIMKSLQARGIIGVWNDRVWVAGQAGQSPDK